MPGSTQKELSENHRTALFILFQQSYLPLAFLPLLRVVGQQLSLLPAASLSQYCSKLAIYLAASCFALAVHSSAEAYVLRGSRISVSQPLIDFGTTRFNTGIFVVFNIFDRTIDDSINDSTGVFQRNTFFLFHSNLCLPDKLLLRVFSFYLPMFLHT